MLLYLCLAVIISKANTDSLFYKADSLFAVQLFQEAAVEYERLVFDSEDTQTINTALYKKALSYKNLSLYSDAILCLKRINQESTDTLFEKLVKYNLAVLHYLNWQYEMVIISAEGIESLNNDSISSTIVFLKGLAHIHLNEYEAGFACIKQVFDSNSIPYTINDFKVHKKSKAFAVITSLLLPGTGQIYAGQVKYGLYSFVFNALAAVVSFSFIANGYYIAGANVGIISFLRLYIGGAIAAANMIDKKQFQNNQLIINSLLKKYAALL